MSLKDQIQRLVSKIEDGLVIPIIGSDLLILNENKEEYELTKFIAREILQNLGSRDLNRTIDIEEVNGLNDVYFSLNKPNDIHQLVKDKIEDKRTFIQENLKYSSYDKLSKIQAFKIYFNASCSDVLEESIRKIRGDCDVFNFYDHKNPPTPQDIDPELINYFTLQKPIIYNLFGIYNQLRTGFIITEDDYIEFVLRFQQFANQLNNLRSLILPKDQDSITYLLIGCNFPNWLFRFFIRTFTSEKLIKLQNKNIVVSDALVQEDRNRTIFCNNHHITSIEGMTSEMFIEELFYTLKDENPDCLIEDFHSQLVFLSYASEDNPTVSKLNESLKKHRIDTWFDADKKIEYGDNIRIEIKEGIDNTSVFVPVISETSLMGDQRRDYWAEWKYAISLEKRGDLEILPLIIDDTSNNALAIPEEFAQKRITRINDENELSEDFVKILKKIQSIKRREPTLDSN